MHLAYFFHIWLLLDKLRISDFISCSIVLGASGLRPSMYIIIEN